MKRRFLPSFIFSFTLFFSLAKLPVTAQIFVKWDATGANNGTSWADAYTDLKAALSAAAAGDEIWVAKGTYKPAAPNGNPASTFLIDKNLVLLGGFDGTEASADQRNPQENETILSGDLAGDDIPDDFLTSRGDNVLNVVRIENGVTNETLFDGFTIKGGHADGSGLNGYGGGIFCKGYPVFRHCIFEQNFASAGGGAVRLNNTAGNIVEFEFCQFKHNKANVGGAMDCLISTYTLMQCTFTNNSAVTGTFQANGGGLWSFKSHGTLVNCLFSGNVAASFGGGIAVYTDTGNFSGSLRLQGCTIADNKGTGSILNASTDSVFLQNTILYNPGFLEFSGNANNFQSLGGNLVRDMSLQSFLVASDKQDIDPLFLASGAGDYRLSDNSPCINEGISVGVTAPLDLDGKLRIAGTTVDIGAYEWGSVSSLSGRANAVIKIFPFPNPASEYLFFQLTEPPGSPGEVWVISASGSLMRRTSPTGQMIDIKDLSPGFYFLKMLSGKQVFLGKFIKQ